MVGVNSSHEKPMQDKITYIGLGSNLNQPEQQLLDAQQALQQLPQSAVLEYSSFYWSKALTIDEQAMPDYLNAVVKISTTLAPLALLDQLQAIESAQGRVRSGKRWQARTLDLDILLYGDECFTTPRLTIPHPAICQRDFVIVPLLEIAPGLVLPGQEKLTDCLVSCGESIRKKVTLNGAVQ